MFGESSRTVIDTDAIDRGIRGLSSNPPVAHSPRSRVVLVLQSKSCNFISLLHLMNGNQVAIRLTITNNISRDTDND